MKPFIIYALPRSRTYWLSKFLSYKEVTCLHDICVETHTVSGLVDILKRPNTGAVDTGLVDGWRLMKRFVPEANIAIIKRPLHEVCQSLKKHGLDNQQDKMRDRRMFLSEVSKEPHVLTVNFYDLHDEKSAKAIFEHCLEREFDRDWWLFWKDKNLQIDMPQRLQRLAINRDKIEALKTEAMSMSA